MASSATPGPIALLLSLALPLVAQQARNESPGAVIRVTVDLVQTDAVVTDSKGKHIGGLQPQDFEILEDGKARKITHFSYVQGTDRRSTQTSQRAAPNERSTAPAEAILSSPKPLRQDQVRRTVVLLADDLGLAVDDVVVVRRAMKSFVDQNMQADDLVSIMTTSGGMGAMEQLTNDRRHLYASIDRIHWVPGRNRLTWYEPVHSVDLKTSPIENASNGRIDSIRRPFIVSGTLNALAYAIYGLREMPGRKAIALFSDGFSTAVDGIVELANRSSVVIYTLDPRGLVSFSLSAVDWCKSTACNIKGEESKREATYRASQRSLDQLARGTGGVFFHDNNALDEGLATAVDDMSSYYLIGFQPKREDFNPLRGNPQFHRMEIKVLRAGMQVRGRSGFLGTPDAPASQPMSDSFGREALRKALFSAFQENGFPVRLSAFYSASGEKVARTGRRVTLLRVMLAIDAHRLRFKDTPEGRKELDLDVVAAAYGANNQVVVSSSKSFSSAMTPDEMNQIVASGLLYGFDIDISKPGPLQLRVAAWDPNSERAGSATAYVEVPDFNRAAIALSSVMLSDTDAKRNEALARSGVLGAGSAVTRSFAPGGVLRYDCTVFGTLIDRQTARPKIDIGVRLFRGPERIFDGQLIPLAIPDGSSLAAIPASGKIKLPETLPPGDYILELSAYDRLQRPKLQRAVEWVDFTLLK